MTQLLQDKDYVVYFSDCVEETNHDPLSAPAAQTPGSIDPKLEKKKPNENVSLADNSLLVDISDALSEKEKVKFTVHTKTTLPEFQKSEFIVVRQHEEFVWLHDRYEENEEYAGYIIPPAPPRPDFDASREKLQRLGEGEGALTREEFLKMKEELEDEYLATFKKTVAMHEVFLQRLAAHPVFRNDSHLRVFLEYEQDLCAKPRGKMDLIGGLNFGFGSGESKSFSKHVYEQTKQTSFFLTNLFRNSDPIPKKPKQADVMRSMTTTTDEIYLGATVRDVNDFFEQETTFLQEYYSHLKEAVAKVDRMTTKHKEVADAHIRLSSCITQLATREQPPTERFLTRAAETFDKCRKIEGRMASDQDLKLADTLRYYMRDAHAAKAVLVRRLRCLAAYEAANRNLEKARAKNKDVHAPLEVQEAEQAQADACAKFEQLSARAREELIDFRTRRVAAFKKSLLDLAELEIKHARSQQELFRKSLQVLKECQ
ncbi:sorting nexin-6 isoform X1 [Spodoptera frugiperda]|uniref:Sorting nexin-6 isoform X1 n=1 Tax=Spodoptera frugiperda TaxID=7108 RepID=A0A9R0F2C1_SPOFR|nr:sorting nexin-6 isoform X1 [Spodoptera frugiperda]